MTQLLGEHGDNMHDVARIVHVKEEHGKKVEDEIGTLGNDYFKPEHMQKYPQLENLLKEATALSIQTRQKIDLNLAKELLEKCMLIAEIFYKSKNVTPVRVKSLYPTEGQLVTYKE
jgi:nickel-type superoxide dismutase